MKKRFLLTFLLLAIVGFAMGEVNLQVFYDFGSQNTAVENQRTNRVSSTVEMFQPDKWGNTYFFVDFDYSINANDPKDTPFGAYWEIARCLNFWQESKLKDLSIQVEYDGGLGIYKDGSGVNWSGYGINHAALVGLNYFLHTEDYKNTFNFELLFKYIADDYNAWRVKDINGNWTKQAGNQVPLQFTFVWTCKDFCSLKGLTFAGFMDIWGQKQSVYNRKATEAARESNPTAYITTDPTKQSFVFISEPQLWYNIGQWFKCENLHIGTEVEFSYNFTGKGFMCNPCLGLKWVF